MVEKFRRGSRAYQRRIEAPKQGRILSPTALLPEIFLRAEIVGRGANLRCISQPTQVGIVSLNVIGRFSGNDLLFLTSEFRLQLFGDGFGHFTLDRKDVSQFVIKRISPNM